MANKKKAIQGKGQRFRGDMWLDQKVSGRTLAALQSRGVKFPEGVNPRKTKAFKEEYKKQTNLFRKEHAAKIAAKKEKARQAQEAARGSRRQRPRNNTLFI